MTDGQHGPGDFDGPTSALASQEFPLNNRGKAAEQLAAAFLQRAGLRIILTNYRCRFGEIDIIARDGPTTVFVEVRHRRSARFGGAGASITAAKQARLRRSAHHYLSHATPPPACRFDAILIDGDPPRVQWLRNAFGE